MTVYILAPFKELETHELLLRSAQRKRERRNLCVLLRSVQRYFRWILCSGTVVISLICVPNIQMQRRYLDRRWETRLSAAEA